MAALCGKNATRHYNQQYLLPTNWRAGFFFCPPCPGVTNWQHHPPIGTAENPNYWVGTEFAIKCVSEPGKGLY